MNKKNTFVLILAVVILFGAIGFASWKITQKKAELVTTEKTNIQKEENPEKTSTTENTIPTTKEQIDFSNKFKEDMQKALEEKAQLTGTVEMIAIGGKSITIKSIDGKQGMILKLTDNTKVYRIDDKALKTEIKVSEIKLGDVVDAEYEKTVNNLVSVTISAKKK